MAAVIRLDCGMYIDENFKLYYGSHCIDDNVRACNQSGYYLKEQTLYSNTKKLLDNIQSLTDYCAISTDNIYYCLFSLMSKRKIILNSMEVDYNNIEKNHIQNWSNGYKINIKIRKNTLILILMCIKRLPKLPKFVLMSIFKLVY